MSERSVVIVEVGPRDGLQNEPGFVPTGRKVELIGRLADCGLSRIEVTAFVSPRWVPQMADHDAVMRSVARRAGVLLSALVPNLRGAAAALAAGAQEIAVFTAASETFCQRNTNCTIAESLSRFLPVMALARDAGVRVRGYVSCALDCPYEGQIAPAQVVDVASGLHDIGCGEVVVSDTIGCGTPERTKRMVEASLRALPAGMLAGHFHDTSGQAVANVTAAWELGVRVFDGAIGGLGGCPYAPGAAGNVATESLVAGFAAIGVATNIDLQRLTTTARWAREILHARESP